MIKSKIGVYARLKPKESKKGKISFEISESSSDDGKSVSKLTITNKKSHDKLNHMQNKLKSNLN
jgi:hypothetical protein